MVLKINDLDLLELNNLELQETEFYCSYSSLPFNRGVVLKRIGTESGFVFSDIINQLNKEINELRIKNTDEIKRIKANNEIHDFIYDLLTHKNIDKKWRYNDDDFFTELSLEFNSQDSFREIGLLEINSEDLLNRLFGLSILGSCYGKMNFEEQQIKFIVQDFVNQLLIDQNDRIIVSTQPWGKKTLGWFECFFILRKNDIIIFAQDDYDKKFLLESSIIKF